MTLEGWKWASEIVHNIAMSIALFCGGIWVLWRFVLQRERFSRVEFSLEATPLGMLDNKVLIELTAVVINRGPVRHWLKDFRFDLHSLPTDSVPAEGEEKINYQTLFSTTLIKKRQWVPNSWDGSFVDAGATQRFTYVTSVPADTAFVLLCSKFKYRDPQSEFHTAQKAVRISGAPYVPPC